MERVTRTEPSMRRSGIFTVAVAMLSAACGGGDPAPATDFQQTTIAQQSTAPVQTTVPTQTTAPEQTTAAPQDAAPTLDCDEIALGSTTTSDLDLDVTSRCYWVEVPDGLSSVTFDLTGLTGNLRMFLGYGFLVTLIYPGTGEYWEDSQDGATDEVVVIENPKPGPYFIDVVIGEPRAVSPFMLGVRTVPETTAPITGATLPGNDVCASPATGIEVGSETTSEIIGKDALPEPREYFCVQVPDGLSSITIGLTGLTECLDLLTTRSTFGRVWSDFCRQGAEREVVIENPEPGPYYIHVTGALPSGTSSPFTLSVTTP